MDDRDSDPTLPWGMGMLPKNSAGGKTISESKLKAFNIGSMSNKKMLSKKEQEEQRKKKEQEEAAQVYQEFVESFDDGKGGLSRSWVKGGVVNHGKGNNSSPSDKERTPKLYRPKSKLAELASTFQSVKEAKDKDDKDEKSGKSEKRKKSNLEMFKEELVNMQKERQERRRVKQGMGIVPEDESRKSRFEPPPESVPPPKPQGAPDDFRSGSYCYTEDAQTTNLYLGNINPKMTEQQLCEAFGRYGPLASIKIMWPRSDEERARGRNCGFVAYMNRKDGERALAALQGKNLMDFEMKLGWGKAVPIPPHPVYIPPSLAELTLPPPPTGLPFNAIQHRKRASRAEKLYGNMPPAEEDGKVNMDNPDELEKALANAIVKVVIPTERSLLHVIHRMIEFVVREGPMFEAMIMNREISNPMFRFLFENQGPAHVYYRWKLFSVLQGDSVYKWRTPEFRMFKGGSLWRPPPVNPYTQGMPEELVVDTGSTKKGQLSESQRDRLEDMLRDLSPEKVKVGDAMVWCLEHAESAEEIVECIAESLSILQTPLPKKVARLYLISDILYNCSAKVPNASAFRKHFEPKLGEIFKDIHNAYENIDARLKAEQFKQRVMGCFRAWEDWAVYPNEYLINLQNVFLGLVAFKALDFSSSAQPREPIKVPEELDGAPLEDVDGAPLSDLDGMPLDAHASPSRDRADVMDPNTDYIDGAAYSEIDGAPISMRDDFDGQPLDDDGRQELPSSKFKFEPSKWESVDETQLEAQAMTLSKWDLLDQDAQHPEKENENMEDLDGQPMEEISQTPSNDRYDSPLVYSREDSPSVREGSQREITEERRAKLREIELKVMKYMDEIESGRRSRKHEITLAEQVDHYRAKLLQKDDDKEKEKERQRHWEEERHRIKEWERAREKEREREARENRERERVERARDKDRSSERRERTPSPEAYGDNSLLKQFAAYGSPTSSPSPSRSSSQVGRSLTPPAAYKENSPSSTKRRRGRSRSPKRKHRSRGGSPRKSKRSRSRSASKSPPRHRHKHKKNKY